MNIPDKEIEDMAIPMASQHPNLVGISAVVFLLMGVFWEPWLALLTLYPIGHFWLEACNTIRWAKRHVELNENTK